MKNQDHQTRGPLIETLEQRAYFDLVPSFVGTLPGALVSAIPNKSVVTVDVTNSGSAVVSGAYTVTVFASLANTITGAPTTQVGTISGTLPNLGPGKFKPLKFKLSDFPSVGNGSYFLLAQVSGALAGTLDNVAPSAAAISVASPFIDLTSTVTNASPASGEVTLGQGFSIAVEVFNNGNIPAIGPLTTDVSVSLSPDGSTPGHLYNYSKTVHIAAGGHTLIHIPEKIQKNYTPATYYWVTTIDPSNTFNETNTDNNTAVSGNTLVVTDPFPNLLGNWTGIDVVTKGPDKGNDVRFSLDFVTEDYLGDLTANGTILNNDGSVFSTYLFTGTVSATGVFRGKTNGYITVYAGKVTGNSLKTTTHDTARPGGDDFGNAVLARVD